MIKKVHYCWLGSPVPENVKVQVSQWKELCPDFDFVEWNEENITKEEYSDIEFWNRVYREKRWAFASDIVQFSKIYEEGGFYLDCDVVMCKPLTDIPAPSNHLVMGYMYDGVLSGGFLYAPPRHPLVKKILEYYRDINDGFYAVNNTIITDCINNNVPDILMNGSYYSSDEYKLTVFPKEYFCQPSFNKKKSFLLDQFAGSWQDGKSDQFASNRGRYGFWQILRRKLSCLKSILKNEFRDVYLNALIGKKVKRTEHWRKCYGMTGGAVKRVNGDDS